ncbi:MAG TPA: hypothetical protein VND62_01865 [Acidimicrobiales bacterium]|nr:hypothetical protein [Acidimicrobiales bacterium]
MVLMVVLVPIAILLRNVVQQSSTARDKLTALSLAEQCIEKLNNTGPTLSQGVPKTGVAILENSHCFGTSPVVESTTTYEVHAEFTWETAQGSHPDLCTSSVTPSLIEAKVWTTWGRTQTVTDSTLLDYPPPSLPNDGFLAVVVNGTPSGSPPVDATGRSWSTRVQSVPVTISRTGFSVTLYPNTYGCVFEEVPAPASYTVTAADPTSGATPASPSWMSASESSTTSQTVTANLDTVTHVTFRYDEGSLVSLQYPSTTATEGPVTCPGLNEVQCVVFGQEPSSSATPAKAPVAEISVLNATSKKWTVAQASGAARLAALSCAGTNRCIAVGYGGTSTYHGVSFSTGTSSSPSFTSDSVPSGVTALSGITCPASTRCYAWGLGTTGAVIVTGTVTGGSVTWGSSVDTLATVPARVTSLGCWSGTRCYAVATKQLTTKPVVLSLSPTTGRKWTTDTLPTTSTYTPLTLTQLTCPAATTCYAVGTRKTSHGEVLSLSAATAKTWTKNTLPSTVSALSALTCPSKTACYAIGTRRAGTTTYGAITSLTTATSWKLDTPTTTRSITSITCPSASACLVLGTGSAGTPALLWRTSASAFTSETVPSSVTGLSSITCASSLQCYAAGVASSGGSAYGVVLSGTSTWQSDTLPSTPTAMSFFGLACGSSACAAPGATETAAFYFDVTRVTGTTWSNATPSVPTGMYTGGVPIAVTNSSLTTNPLEVTVPSGTTAATRVGPLFPFSSGYGVAASDCKPLGVSVQVSTTPGATATATMPMGMLEIRVVNRYGTPDTGATITAAPVTGASCTLLAPPTGKTNPASFNLEPTGPLGMSQVVVPYGSYKVTVTHAGHVGTITKVSVNPTSVAKTTGSSQALASPFVVTLT